MTWEQLSNLTPDNGAIQSLKDLIIAEVFTDPELERFFTMKFKVNNGDKLGYSGEMSDVGWAGAGCNPSYKKPKVEFAEKAWKIGDWQIPLEFCYTELNNTIAEYCLKTGTDIADLTSTEYMDEIIYPKLKDAMRLMFWRMIWFGDTEAKVHTSSGVLTTGVDPELFKATDGLFKHLFAVGTKAKGQKVEIAANAQESTALQFSTLRTPKVAIGIFDSLLENADSRIQSIPGAGIFATKSLCDALTRDLKNEYKDRITWEQIFEGLDVTEYNGVPVYRVAIWDRFIQEYQNNGTKLNIPHRAVFGSPREMFVGTPANDIVSDLDIFFEQKTRMNYIYSTGKIGTLIGQDNLFQLAY